jgi:hypothetical protein
MAAGAPEWVVREDAGIPVLVALYLRQSLGIRYPEELPQLRGVTSAAAEEFTDTAALERQWRAYWDMTVEPQAHTSPVPLELVDDFATFVALPTEGAEELRAAIALRRRGDRLRRSRGLAADSDRVPRTPARAGRRIARTRARSRSTSAPRGAGRTRSS